MKIRNFFYIYIFIFILYILILSFIDSSKGYFGYMPVAFSVLPAIVFMTLISFSLRYLRWYLLLRWSDIKISKWKGWLAYLSGFAFTATPGKLGELVRIRYFGILNVDAKRVVSVFVFERIFDLIIIFFLASISLINFQMLGIASFLLLLFILVWGLAVFRFDLLSGIYKFCAVNRLVRVETSLRFVEEVMLGCRLWLKPWPILISLLLGLCAWSLTAYSFYHLLSVLNIDVDKYSAFSTYPFAMLIGAVSMLPGGIGSTEAAIVFQLHLSSVPIDLALLAAIVIRLGTLWFSVVCGILAILVQEFKLLIKVYD